eukprot:m.123165 g.123165  ORF g.123165 m.123165 type:complete len:521 (+) comp16583_c0_seq1:200-1762(+)
MLHSELQEMWLLAACAIVCIRVQSCNPCFSLRMPHEPHDENSNPQPQTHNHKPTTILPSSNPQHPTPPPFFPQHFFFDNTNPTTTTTLTMCKGIQATPSANTNTTCCGVAACDAGDAAGALAAAAAAAAAGGPAVPDMCVSCLARHAAQSSAVVLDLRSPLEFGRLRLAAAANVSGSRMLQRRLAKGSLRTVDLLPPCHQAAFEHVRQAGQAWIVIYGGQSDTGAAQRVLSALAKESQKCTYVIGGHAAVATTAPHLLVQGTIQHPQAAPAGLPTGASSTCTAASSASTSTAPRPAGLCFVPQAQAQTQTLPPPQAPQPPVDEAPVTTVLPGLLLGSAADAGNAALLQQLGVTRVLNVSTDIPNFFEASDATTAPVYRRIPVLDSWQQPLASYFHDAAAFIADALARGEVVLVHCRAGVSRSPTVVLAFLMKHFCQPLSKVYPVLKNERPCVSPNLDFLGQLLQFDRELKLMRGEHANMDTELAALVGMDEPNDVATAAAREPEPLTRTPAMLPRAVAVA